MEFICRNVNDAFSQIITRITALDLIDSTELVLTNSRNGGVIRFRDPVRVTYTKPWERVLFHPGRMANPFFHLYESLWMLSGRFDVKSVAYFVNRMREFSDDGETFYGAYGRRWRSWFKYDQIEEIIGELIRNPDSRRCVLQMWDGRTDLNQTIEGGKDVPCNLSSCFDIVDGHLNMTVFNRSNDIVWGALGANAVHFSFLQEYIARALNVKIGKYHQISNNFHVYTWNYHPELWTQHFTDERYDYPESIPLFETNQEREFDRELEIFLDNPEAIVEQPFLRDVAAPMVLAYRHYKEKDWVKANEALMRVTALDWRLGGAVWLDVKEKAYNAKTS